MRDIKVWIHDGRIYQTPRYVLENQVDDYIKAWKNELFEEAKRFNMDHYVYCTKTYNVENELIEIDLYQQCLTDEQFRNRTDEVSKDAAEQGNFVYFGVWHKGTAY